MWRKEIEGLHQATQKVLAAIQEGDSARIRTAQVHLVKTLNKVQSEGLINPAHIQDQKERQVLEESIKRLQNLTTLSAELAKEKMTAINQALVKVAEGRKMTKGSRYITEKPQPTFHRTG